MKLFMSLLILGTLLFNLPLSHARDRIKLQTTIIKGNKEMPQIVYIVPWKDMKDHGQTEQTLVLHSLFGNLFDPVHARDVNNVQTGKISRTKSRQ